MRTEAPYSVQSKGDCHLGAVIPDDGLGSDMDTTKTGTTREARRLYIQNIPKLDNLTHCQKTIDYCISVWYEGEEDPKTLSYEQQAKCVWLELGDCMEVHGFDPETGEDDPYTRLYRAYEDICEVGDLPANFAPSEVVL